MTDDIFQNLPEDPELAFVKLVEHFDRELDEKVQRSEERSDTSIFTLDYMNQVIAAANELGIDILSDYELPAEGNVWQAYGEFSRRVKNIVLRINIRNSRAVREFSVELDSAAKAKIHSYIGAIRTLIEREHVEERRKPTYSTS